MSGLAIVTGASTGIGRALAECAARDGHELILAADEPLVHAVAGELGELGARARAVEADLSTPEGVERLIAAADGRPIDILCANAGTGVGGAFMEQDFATWRRTVDTNITGTLLLVQRVLSGMIARKSGRVLVTGSIAGYVPGPFNAVYNASKAFVDSFTEALRNELKDVAGVSLTTLMPGATETRFFARAGMLDTAIGRSSKADPDKVARDGWEAMLAGKDHVVPGLMNKLQVAASGVAPEAVKARIHRAIAEPDGGAD
jgi:short-subunit dehydrogenase